MGPGHARRKKKRKWNIGKKYKKETSDWCKTKTHLVKGELWWDHSQGKRHYLEENLKCDIAEIDSANKAWKKLDELCIDGGLVNGTMNMKQLTHFVKPKDVCVQEYFA
ncbi:hypothetical protein PR048_007995 [Dryococelus australis]|uniref:Uncharacterized protein n=1 Tax=Dryococelus australis TaxID=614101 RepID=A0ABQ9HWN7_9NEOP|nr:hypothetical protein PR048_007995 [Dryococelus australis]